MAESEESASACQRITGIAHQVTVLRDEVDNLLLQNEVPAVDADRKVTDRQDFLNLAGRRDIDAVE